MIVEWRRAVDRPTAAMDANDDDGYGAAQRGRLRRDPATADALGREAVVGYAERTGEGATVGVHARERMARRSSPRVLETT